MQYGKHRSFFLRGDGQPVLVFHANLPSHIIATVFAVRRQPVCGRSGTLLLIRRPIHGQQIVHVVAELVQLRVIPRVRARLPRIFQRDHMVDLHRRRRFHPTHELDGLTGIRIVKRARRNLSSYGRSYIARPSNRGRARSRTSQPLPSSSVSESERVAIISGLVGIVVDRKFFQRFCGGAGCRVFAGNLTYGRIDFRQKYADSDADYRNDDQQNENAFQRTVSIDPTFFEPFAGPLNITYILLNIPIIIRITIILFVP